MFNSQFGVKNELNLTNQTELIANSKRAEFNLKKFVINSSQILNRTNFYRIKSNSNTFDLTYYQP
jgi:hypothetical protein